MSKDEIKKQLSILLAHIVAIGDGETEESRLLLTNQAVGEFYKLELAILGENGEDVVSHRLEGVEWAIGMLEDWCNDILERNGEPMKRGHMIDCFHAVAKLRELRGK